MVHHKCHRGLAAARNTAVAACTGEFIFHVDSDDWVETNAVELLVKKQQETNADIVTAEAYIYENGLKSDYYSGGWHLDRESLLTRLLSHKVSTSIWRRLIRRALYTDNDIFCNERGSVGEDFQVLPRLVYYAKKVSGIKDPLYNYEASNQHSITECSQKDVEMQMQSVYSVKVISTFFSNKEPYSELVAGLDILNIHKWLVNNAAQKNRTGYRLFLKYLREFGPSYWKVSHHFSVRPFKI